MKLQTPLSFDGNHVCNGDKEKTQLAFLIRHLSSDEDYDFSGKERERVGRLFEKAPEMLELIKDLGNLLTEMDYPTDDVNELVKYIESGK